MQNCFGLYLSKILLKLKYIYILCPKHNANKRHYSNWCLSRRITRSRCIKNKAKINPTSPPKSKILFPPYPPENPLSPLPS